MIAKWKQFTEEQLQEMAYQASSNSSWLKLMGYTGTGGVASKVPQQIIAKYPNIDISHFTGQGWNIGNNSYEKLSSAFNGKKDTVKRALLAHRENKCECCGLEQWLDKPIPLEVHHKDGDNTNNDPDNLQLLCPNCHALTNYYRGRNVNTGTEKISDEDFIQALQNSSNIHQALLSLGLTAKGANYARAYKIIEQYNIKHLKK